MKCKICGGTGTSNTCVNGTFKPCTFCDGTGEYEPFDADIELDKLDSEPQTNEEWLRQASTEELADVLTEIACESYYDGLGEKLPLKHNCKHFMKWLKEKHDGSV